MKVARFNRALRAFQKARRLAKKPRLKAKINLQLGVTYGVLGRENRARRAFERSLNVEPGLAFDRSETKETVVALYDAVRASMRGTLSVEADRDGVNVIIDGRPVGTSPLTVEVAVGRCVVEAQTEDGLYRTQTETVVRQGTTAVVALTLDFVGARLKVGSAPLGAKVTVDGEAAGEPPLVLELTPGSHTVTIGAPGHESRQWSLDLKPGQSRQVDANLPANTPAPAVVSRPKRGIEPTDRHKRGLPVWTLVTAATSVALAGAGVGLAVAADSAWGEYRNTKNPNRYDELRNDIEGYDAGMAACFALAGAAAAGSLMVYLLVERPTARSAEEAPAVALKADGRGLLLEF